MYRVTEIDRNLSPSRIITKHDRLFKLASIEVSEDQASNLHPSLLRVDYKQNLLVWPVVAGGITRSPPLTPSL